MDQAIHARHEPGAGHRARLPSTEQLATPGRSPHSRAQPASSQSRYLLAAPRFQRERAIRRRFSRKDPAGRIRASEICRARTPIPVAGPRGVPPTPDHQAAFHVRQATPAEVPSYEASGPTAPRTLEASGRTITSHLYLVRGYEYQARCQISSSAEADGLAGLLSLPCLAVLGLSQRLKHELS